MTWTRSEIRGRFVSRALCHETPRVTLRRESTADHWSILGPAGHEFADDLGQWCEFYGVEMPTGDDLAWLRGGL